MSDNRPKEQQEKFPLRVQPSSDCICGHHNDKHSMPINFNGMIGKCTICICDSFISPDSVTY